MAVCLETKVGSTRHNYKEIQVQRRQQQQQFPTPEVFVPNKDESSMEFHKMVSTCSTTDHYSPGAENWSVSTADLACLRVAHTLKDFSILSTVWLGTFARPAHHIVWRHKSAGSSWYFAVLNFKDSAVLMHPATNNKVKVNGKVVHCWEAMVKDEGPTVKPVYDLNHYEAFFSFQLSNLLN